MRKFILILFGFLILAACSPSADVGPLPTRAQSVDLNPRILATATPILPPTWTPAPQEDGEHLPESLIAVEATVPASPEGRKTYVVQAGDTLGEIAAEFGVTLASLAEENGIRNWDIIEVGTTLIIPEN